MTDLLEVENLGTWFYTRQGIVKAVDGVDFAVASGETLAIVGESGCGKSMTALSLMRLIPDPPGRIVSGEIKLGGKDLLKLSEEEMRKRPRQRDLDDLPGADDHPQPGHDHRQADRRGADPASRHGQEGGLEARHRDARPGEDPRAAAARARNIRTSSRAACASAP